MGCITATKHFDNSTCIGTIFQLSTSQHYNTNKKEQVILRCHVLKTLFCNTISSNNGDFLWNSSTEIRIRELASPQENTTNFLYAQVSCQSPSWATEKMDVHFESINITVTQGDKTTWELHEFSFNNTPLQRHSTLRPVRLGSNKLNLFSLGGETQWAEHGRKPPEGPKTEHKMLKT